MVCTVLEGQNKWDHCTHLTWNLGHRMKWDHYKHPLPYHFVLCWGDLFALDHVCGYQYALLKGQCVYGLYRFAGTEQLRPLHASYLKLGHWLKWDHYMHPLLYHCVLCWGDLFSLDHVCGYPYALLKGQCVYGLYSFGGAEVRTLHTPYLKSGSQDEVRPLQPPLIISLCALLGVIFSH